MIRPASERLANAIPPVAPFVAAILPSIGELIAFDLADFGTEVVSKADLRLTLLVEGP